MNRMIPQVDGYIRKNGRWGAELQKLREILMECPLTEEVKWRVPCYTFEGGNVALMGAFKESCVLSFVKGALLKDGKGILIQQTENSQSVRVIRFAGVGEIEKLSGVLKAYVLEAIEVERAGLKVTLKKTSEFAVPGEFQRALDADAALKGAFGALTPGRQRGYLLYFSGAKQSKTRESRVEKCIPRIFEGKGLEDE